MTKNHLHHWTPTLYSMPLSRLSKKNVWLKMECNQPVGSYKIRGIGHLCQHYADEGATHFVSSSGGNAGLTVAYVGRLLNIKVDVFIPKTSHEIFIKAIELQGASVHVQGDVWDETHKLAMDYVNKNSSVYIPPFDHPLLWHGHSTMIDEVMADNVKPDAIVVAIGGGGMACGVIEGMKRNCLNDTALYGVETIGAASFNHSVKANKLIKLDSVDTIATSLAAKKVTNQLFKYHQEKALNSIVVSDTDTVEALTSFLDDHRVLVEPSAGAALSLIYKYNDILSDHENVLVIVCGGVGVSLELLKKWRQQFALDV